MAQTINFKTHQDVARESEAYRHLHKEDLKLVRMAILEIKFMLAEPDHEIPEHGLEAIDCLMTFVLEGYIPLLKDLAGIPPVKKSKKNRNKNAEPHRFQKILAACEIEPN